MVTEEVEEEAEKWVKHYCSLHQILLVGEGDFSFSLSLALSFGSASNIVATSLDPFDTVIKKYNKAKSNLHNLENLGASLLHEVDATEMKLHTDLKMRKFDRIIFNFPHAGFYGKEDNSHVIRMHKNLVQGFFRNASGMLRPDGEIHVNHKITAPFCYWNLDVLASQSSLALIECVDFRIGDYPGYNNKRGAGPKCDNPFPLGECCTFKFRFSPNTKKNPKLKKIQYLAHRGTYQHQEIPNQMLRQPITLNYSHSRTELTANTNYSPVYAGPPLARWRTHQLQENPIWMLQQPITFNSSQSRTGLTANTHSVYAGPPLAHMTAYQLQENPNQMLRQPITFNSSQYMTEFTTNANYTLGYVGPPLAHRRTQQVQEIPSRTLQQQPIQSRAEFTVITNYSPGYVGSSSTDIIRSKYYRIFGGYLNLVKEAFGRPDFDLNTSVHEVLRLGFERYMSEMPERTINDYIHLLQELHPLSILSSAWLRRMLLGLDH